MKEGILKEISKGCGKDYLSEEGEFEMMCGKHIWKTPSEIATTSIYINLCPAERIAQYRKKFGSRGK